MAGPDVMDPYEAPPESGVAPPPPGGNPYSTSSASPQARALFNSMTPAQQQQILASWGGQDLMEEWYQNALAAGAANWTKQWDTLQSGGGSDVYSTRDWSGSANAQVMDAQYQRLLGMGIDPARARRIVAVALGGMEHDWQQYQNTPMDNSDGWGTAEERIARFLESEKFYDPVNCPQEAPYRPSDGSGGCVEKPWDSNAGGGEGGGGGGGQGGGATGPQGLAPSPASQAPTGGAPGGGGTTGEVNPNLPVMGGGTQSFTPSASTVTAPQVSAPQVKVSDPWKTTGAGGGGATQELDKIASPYASKSPAGFTSFTGINTKPGGRQSTGWNGGGNWVASDERLKDIGLAPRFSDWRRKNG